MNKYKFVLGLTAIGAITWLETYALSKGVDGYILAAVVASIAGLGGYAAARKRK